MGCGDNRPSSADNDPSSSPKLCGIGSQPWAPTAYMASGSHSENGFIESINARLRNELLDGEISYTLREAQIIVKR